MTEKLERDTDGCDTTTDKSKSCEKGDKESVCCLLVLNSVTTTPQWIRQMSGKTPQAVCTS
jgi:hypothetical protein